MKRTDEIKKEITNKMKEIETLEKDGKLDEAVAAAEDLDALRKELKIEQAREAYEADNFQKKEIIPVEAGQEKHTDAELALRGFNKMLFGRHFDNLGAITPEERKAYFDATSITGSPGQPGQIEGIPGKGGYIVPEEQMKELLEFRKAYTQLKDYVTVVNVTAPSGKYPTINNQQLQKFQTFAELTKIPEADFDFGQASWDIDDYGMIIPVSNQLIQDASFNIMSIIGEQLAYGAVITENEEILAPLTTLATAAMATPITSYKALNKALFKTLDRIYFNNAKIYTNQSGLNYLMDLDDGNARPLFVPDVTNPNVYRYRGKEVVVADNLSMPDIVDTTASPNVTYAPFYIGDMKRYMRLHQRLGLELAVSTEYLFDMYGTAVRAVMRFGTEVVDTDAMKALVVQVS